jgi:hypothetical protein
MQKLPYQEEHTTFDISAGGKFNKNGYRDDIKTLEELAIWSGSDGARTLWDHQKQAIAFCAAYSRVTHPLPLPEAGLVKMPTGTGKSGVVAVLPNIRNLIDALGDAHRWLDELTKGPRGTIASIAAREKKTDRSICMTMSLAFLSPALVKAAIDGRLPRGFGVTRLMDLPMAWSDQWSALNLTACYAPRR